MSERQSCRTPVHMDVELTITNDFWNTIRINYTCLKRCRLAMTFHSRIS